jgi:CYTH domain-containing protein
VAVEIERKFLVRPGFRPPGKGLRLVQGYLPTRDRFTARVRVAGARAFLTLKGPARGAARDEYEYAIPRRDAEELLRRYCGGRVVEKVRHVVPFAGRRWEVDVYAGANRGLVTAELESRRRGERLSKPPWLGRELTGQRRYDNSALAVRPIRR